MAEATCAPRAGWASAGPPPGIRRGRRWTSRRRTCHPGDRVGPCPPDTPRRGERRANARSPRRPRACAVRGLDLERCGRRRSTRWTTPAGRPRASSPGSGGASRSPLWAPATPMRPERRRRIRSTGHGAPIHECLHRPPVLLADAGTGSDLPIELAETGSNDGPIEQLDQVRPPFLRDRLCFEPHRAFNLPRRRSRPPRG